MDFNTVTTLKRRGNRLGKKGLEWMEEKLVKRPSTLFLKKDWKTVERECEAFGFNRDVLRKVFLGVCEFNGWHRGGVILEKFFVQKCHLDYYRLDTLALKLLSTRELVEVVECLHTTQPGKMIKLDMNNSNSTNTPQSSKLTNNTKARRRSTLADLQRGQRRQVAGAGLRGLVVQSTRPPHGTFCVFLGFTEAQRQGKEGFSPGERIVIRHLGIRNDVRECPSFLSRESDTALVAMVLEEMRYASIHDKTREKAKDEVQEAREKLEKEQNSVSFILFARWLFEFCSLSYEELARFAATRFFTDESILNFIDLLHGEFSSIEEKRLLTTLAKQRFEIDTQGKHGKDKVIQFMEKYPILLTPLVTIQSVLRRVALRLPQVISTLYPTAPRQAWVFSARELVRRILKSHLEESFDIRKGILATVRDEDHDTRGGHRKTAQFSPLPELQTKPGTAPSQQRKEMLQRTSTIRLFQSNNVGKDATANTHLNRISEITATDTLAKAASSKRNRSAVCPGCATVTYVKPTSYCANCETLATQLLATFGGYSYAKGFLRKAESLAPQDKDHDPEQLWIEQYDRKSSRSFFFNVVAGTSSWTLPKNVGHSRLVKYFTPEELLKAKRRKTPEWQAFPKSIGVEE